LYQFPCEVALNSLARKKGQEFAKFLESLPDDKKFQGNEETIRASNQEYKKFQESFSRNHCYLCNQSLEYFNKESPCLHWLLKQSGAKFKKTDFFKVANKFRFFQMQSYLRWVANQDGFARNINDLNSLEKPSQIIEESIRWRNLEWSFSSSESDYLGHPNTKWGTEPHYHFQMRVDGYPIIKFNHFHIPFHEMDVIEIEATRCIPTLIKRKHTNGEGMADILNENTVEHIVRASESSGNVDEATFNIHSLIVADEGTKLSGDDLANLFEQATKRNVPVASLLDSLPNSKSKVIVYPGPGVAEGFSRDGRSKKKNK
jgi:hypothetical protein